MAHMAEEVQIFRRCSPLIECAGFWKIKQGITLVYHPITLDLKKLNLI